MSSTDDTGLQSLQATPDAVAPDAGTEFQTLHEFVRAAHAKLDRNTWDYLIGGAETESTIMRNRWAIDCINFRPRVLRPVFDIDLSSSFFGEVTALPLFLCPVGSLGSFHANGGKAAATAAGRYGVPIFVSSSVENSMETVAAAAPTHKVFQLYPRGDAAWIDDYIVRAKAAGYKQLCMTVDNPVTSRRDRDLAKRYVKAWRRQGKSIEYNATFSWDDLKRIKDVHKMPTTVKGIATAEDAEIACQIGLDAVYVSNHGGRQLDHGRGTIEVLPEVVSAVAGRARVFIDGGFYRGNDIVKAIALGADAVGIGRTYIYGLAAAGEVGVTRVLEILAAEIRTCIALLGITQFCDLKPAHLHYPVQPMRAPHVHSAFPLLHLPEQTYD
jgi:isopentenyl diphosphate isomerase/L-lactate dehydrogenase-like FMN-dependent dehydrogenase